MVHQASIRGEEAAMMHMHSPYNAVVAASTCTGQLQPTTNASGQHYAPHTDNYHYFQTASSSSLSSRPHHHHHRISESSSSTFAVDCYDHHDDDDDDLLEGLSPSMRNKIATSCDLSSWSNTILSTNSSSTMESIASLASSLSFQDPDVIPGIRVASPGDRDRLLLTAASAPASEPAGAAPPSKRKGRHRRSPNMAMGSQDFFEKVLKQI